MDRTIKSQEQFNRLLNEALGGDRLAQGMLKEAITTSDLPTFYRRIANAELENQYPEVQPVWEEFASRVDLNDFRPTNFYELVSDSSMLQRENGGITMPDGALPRVPELTPYPTFQYKQSEKFVRTAKHGARLQWSFEAFINDEWDQIAALPAEATLLARNTEDILATLMLVTSSGVNSTNFNEQNDNVLKAADPIVGDVTGIGTSVPANAPLSQDALFAALAQAKAQKDGLRGNPVVVNQFVLVVPPGLTNYANLLVNATQYEQVVDGRTYTVTNSLPASVRVVENPWITSINTSPEAAGFWFLLPDRGRTANGRRTIVETFLRGRDTPELRYHANQGVYLGGGDVPYTEGSFDNDDAEIRLRHIVGSGFLNPGGTIASNGTGEATP